MSGYTEIALAQGGKLDDSETFLQKPFRKKELAAKLRALLGTAA